MTAQVTQGALPKLADRLPDKPAVVKPLTRAGTYGGAIHTPAGDSNIPLYVTCGYEPLMRWIRKPNGALTDDQIIPGVAEALEVNADATEFTFRLRRGMKWSDGHPFTADDVVFAIDDVLLEKELYPVPPAELTVDGKPGRVEKLDDYTFKIIFPKTNGLFRQVLAFPELRALTHLPRHYFEKFHKKYNPDADKLAKKAGLDHWTDLFYSKGGPDNWANNPDQPCLWAWQPATRWGDSNRVKLERNPYYWKVDPDGSQLPYVDEFVFAVGLDPETTLLKTTAGEINYLGAPEPRDKPILARSRQQGGYRFGTVASDNNNVLAIQLNQAHEDPVKRKIFQSKDFRVGLSYAINRQEIIDATMQRQGEPYQVAPLPGSPFYDKEFATQYLEHDLGRAQAALDRAYPDRDSEGRRLGPDGEPITFTVEFNGENYSDQLELIQGYWKKVGVQIDLKNESYELWNERVRVAGRHDASVFIGQGGLFVAQFPYYYFPQRSASLWGVAWAEWYSSNGAAGKEPPARQKRQMELYNQLLSTADQAKQTELMKEVLGIAKELFDVIGVARSTADYYVVADKLANVADPMIGSWVYPTPGPSDPHQYSFGL